MTPWAQESNNRTCSTLLLPKVSIFYLHRHNVSGLCSSPDRELHGQPMSVYLLTIVEIVSNLTDF